VTAAAVADRAVTMPSVSLTARQAGAVALVASLAFVAQIPFFSLPPELGSDWWWYVTGVHNLAAGEPLYDPRLLAGPYNFVDPANIYAYNMAPWVIAMIAPFAALGEAGRSSWLIAMDLATALAIMLCLPARHRTLAAALLLASPVALMLFAWGNVGSLVLLGVAVWLVGWRRGSNTLMAVGLVLASVKVLPAIPLALVMLRERRWVPVAAAAAVTGGVTIALMLATGRNVLEDSVLTLANIDQLAWHNLAPSLYVGHATEIRAACIIVIAALAMQRPRYWTIAAMELAACGLVTNLYLDWLLVPVLIGFAYFGASRQGQAGWPSRLGLEWNAAEPQGYGRARLRSRPEGFRRRWRSGAPGETRTHGL
jgi:hypothetical protein